MIDVATVERHMRDANPLPHLDDINADEFARFVAAAHTKRAALMQAPTQHPTETAPTPQAPKRRTRHVWAFAAAFIIVLLGIGAAALLMGGDQQPVVDEPSIDIESLVWTRVPHDEALFGLPGEGGACVPVPDPVSLGLDSHCVVMLSVTTGGPGFVAVGGTGRAAAVWTSPDGVSWSRAPHDETNFTWVEGSSVGTLMHDVTEGGPGLVAVGETGRRPAVWTSSDGVTWTQVPPGAMGFTGGRGGSPLRGVDSGDSRIVAVGDDVVWTSSDGITWSTTTEGSALSDRDDRIWLSDVTAGGPGFVAVGHDVWTSTDGVSWSPSPQDDATFAPWPFGVMSSVTEGGPGLVAVGNVEGAAVWTSTDGFTWSRVNLEEEGTMHSVVPVGDGLVAVGTVDGAPAAWTSSDGVTWSRVPHDDAVFGEIPPDQDGWGETDILSITAGPEGIVAVGHDGDDAAVWIAEPGS